MKTISCYLAGDVSRTFRWRLIVMKECQDLPVEFLSPRDNLIYSHQSMSKHHKRERSFHIEDIQKVQWADVVFAYMSQQSKSWYCGTSIEMFYASYVLRKPVFFVNELKPAKQHKLQFAIRFADPNLTFKSLDEGISALRKYVLNMNYLSKED